MVETHYLIFTGMSTMPVTWHSETVQFQVQATIVNALHNDEVEEQSITLWLIALLCTILLIAMNWITIKYFKLQFDSGYRQLEIIYYRHVFSRFLWTVSLELGHDRCDFFVIEIALELFSPHGTLFNLSRSKYRAQWWFLSQLNHPYSLCVMSLFKNAH